MRLASFTDYSLRVLIYLALKGEELSTVAEIADKYQISRNHLVKVVHNLSTTGLIETYKGKGGGLVLATTPYAINIGKVIRILEQDSPMLECFGEKNECRINPVCKLKVALQEARNNFFATLDQYTLADMIINQKQLSSILFN